MLCPYGLSTDGKTWRCATHFAVSHRHLVVKLEFHPNFCPGKQSIVCLSKGYILKSNGKKYIDIFLKTWIYTNNKQNLEKIIISVFLFSQP